MNDQIDGGQSLRAWAENEALPLLEQGHTRPEVVAALTSALPLRYIDQTVRPALRDIVGQIAAAHGFLVVSRGVNESGQSRQLPLISLDEILEITAKRLQQIDNDGASLEAMLDEWCALHPEYGMTPALLIAQARTA